MTHSLSRLNFSALWKGYARRLRGAGLSAACLLAVTGSSAIADDAKPLYTAKPRFRIPFQFDAGEMRRLGATEIQLYLSTDQGANWSQQQTVEPGAGKFSFEAPGNGEYWFAVKTIDKNHAAHPDGTLEAGLKVIVDSTAPALTLDVAPLGSDRVSLSWDVSDDHADLSTLQLEWRDESSREWQPVSFFPAPSGQTSWSTRGKVEVRGSVNDLAGNTGSASDEAAGSGSTSTIATPSLPASPSNRSRRETEPDFSKPVADAVDHPRAMPSEVTAAPAPEFREVKTAQAPDEPDFGSLPIVRSQEPSSFYRQPRIYPSGKSTSGYVAMTPSGRSAPPAFTTPSKTLSAPAAPVATTPQDETPSHRSVRSRSFKIGYQLDDVGPSGVATVDLYITEDGGRKWFHYGKDADCRSPFDVIVPSDGEYGFSICVQSGVGVVTDPPQPGDAPDIRITVDQAPPIASLAPLRQGQGAAHNEILIEWSLSDDHLADEPVALSYSESPAGPWLPITSWTANTGRFIWTINEPVRQQIFVKLEARDSAGNLTEVKSTHSVLVDLAKPRARIVDVEADTRPAPQ
jgi:hypothetical protein